MWTSAWPDPGAVSSFLSQPCFFPPPLSRPAPAPSALCSRCPQCWVASPRFGILLAPSPPQEGAARIPPPWLSLAVGAGEGEGLEEAEARRAPLLLPAPPLRAPRTRLAPAASIVLGLPGRVLQPSGVRQRRGLPDSHKRGTCPWPAWGKVSTGKGDACCSRPTSTAPGTFGVEETSRPRGDAFPASSRGVDVAQSGRRRVLAVAFVTSLAAGCSRC